MRKLLILLVILLSSCNYDYSSAYDTQVKSYGVIKDSVTDCFIKYAKELIKYNNIKDTINSDSLVKIVVIQDSLISEYNKKKDYYTSTEFLINNKNLIDKKPRPVYDELNDTILLVKNYNIKINLLTNELIDE